MQFGRPVNAEGSRYQRLYKKTSYTKINFHSKCLYILFLKHSDLPRLMSKKALFVTSLSATSDNARNLPPDSSLVRNPACCLYFCLFVELFVVRARFLSAFRAHIIYCIMCCIWQKVFERHDSTERYRMQIVVCRAFVCLYFFIPPWYASTEPR